MFVLLSAKLCGEVNEPAYRAASLVELLHTATLVHDDVVDDSMERRGFFSTYALWKEKPMYSSGITCWQKVCCFPWIIMITGFFISFPMLFEK